MIRTLGVSRSSAWAAAGAGAYSLGQFFGYVFVAKLCSVEELGRFALATAWVTPVMLAARLQLRYVLAADAAGHLPFAAAAKARLLATPSAAVWIAAAAFALCSPETAWALAFVALIRAAEDTGDLLLGVLQRAGDWPRIARSLALRGLGGAGVFGVALAWTRSVNAALPAVLLWQAALTVFHDWPAARGRIGAPERASWAGVSWARAFTTVRMHLALGGAAALVSLNAYVPRYAIERFLGLEALGVYTALAQLALAGNLAVQAIGQAAVTPLSRLYEEDRRGFGRRVAGLASLALAIGLLGLAASWLAGDVALGIIYTAGYAQYGRELVWLMGAAALTYATAVLGYALVAAGERTAQLAIFALSTAVALVASLIATPRWGLEGAAAALLLAWATAAAGAAITLLRRARACRKVAASPTLSPWPRTESARPGGAR